MSWCERTIINKPQSNSVGAASLIFISGGMNIAWSFSISNYTTYIISEPMRYCWFIAAMFAALIGAPLATRLPKKILFFFSGTLVLLGGILFVALPGDYNAIAAARCFDGLATGLIIPLIVAMASEESVKELRGLVTSSTEAMSFALGIFLEQMYISQWTVQINADFPASRVHGLISICCGIIALLLAFFLTIESPIFYLVRNNEHAAVDCLRRLQKPGTLTPDTYIQLEEHKRYIAENKEMTFGDSAVAGLWSLLKLCFYRGMLALSFSHVLITAFSLTLLVTTSLDMWPLFIVGLCRFLGILISVFLMDSMGRKIPMLFGTLICGGLAIGIGVLFDEYSNLFIESKMYTAMALICVYQFFAGLSVTSSSVYLGEAFPLAIKTYFASVVFTVEMLIQIIVIASRITLAGMVNYFYVLGAFSFVFFVFALFCFPETKKLSLLEAQNRFRSLLSLNAY